MLAVCTGWSGQGEGRWKQINHPGSSSSTSGERLSSLSGRWYGKGKERMSMWDTGKNELVGLCPTGCEKQSAEANQRQF